MNTAKILLRIAAVLMFIHLAGHTIGHSGWKKSTDSVQSEVIKQMTGPKFPFMGRIHSMGEYFDGYGIGCSICMAFFILVLWIISDHLNDTSKLPGKLILTVAVCLLAWGIDELIFFFPFAAGNTLTAFLCIIAAFIMYKRSCSRV